MGPKEFLGTLGNRVKSGAYGGEGGGDQFLILWISLHIKSAKGPSDTVFNLNPPELELGLGYDNYGEWVDCSRAVSGQR